MRAEGGRRALKAQREAFRHKTKKETVHEKVTATPRERFFFEVQPHQLRGERNDFISLQLTGLIHFEFLQRSVKLFYQLFQ